MQFPVIDTTPVPWLNIARELAAAPPVQFPVTVTEEDPIVYIQMPLVPGIMLPVTDNDAVDDKFIEFADPLEISPTIEAEPDDMANIAAAPPLISAVRVTPLLSVKPPPAAAVVVAPSFHNLDVAEAFVIDWTLGELSTATVNPFVNTSSVESGA
jgi:hypothetical protein